MERQEDDLKNECLDCKYFDDEDESCTAFECWGLGFLDGCPPLPCENKEN